jgi:hypothetical protein
MRSIYSSRSHFCQTREKGFHEDKVTKWDFHEKYILSSIKLTREDSNSQQPGIEAFSVAEKAGEAFRGGIRSKHNRSRSVGNKPERSTNVK